MPSTPELPRLERAVTGRDDHDARREGLARLGADHEQLLAVLLHAVEGRDLLAEVHLRLELEALLDAEVDEALALHLRVAGDVEEVLLGVDGRDLAAELLEALDDPNRRVAVAGVVGSREPDGAAADDRDVADALAHTDVRLAGGRASGRANRAAFRAIRMEEPAKAGSVHTRRDR